jgi:hypothetical protein
MGQLKLSEIAPQVVKFWEGLPGRSSDIVERLMSLFPIEEITKPTKRQLIAFALVSTLGPSQLHPDGSSASTDSSSQLKSPRDYPKIAQDSVFGEDGKSRGITIPENNTSK